MTSAIWVRTATEAIALRQSLDRLVHDIGDMDQIGDVADAPPRLDTAQAADMGDEVEELSGGHIGIGRRPLGQVAGPALGRQRLGFDVVAADERRAGGRREKAGDHLHRRRFAGAVGPEKAQHLAFGNRERHAVDRRQRAEFFDEMADLQHTLRSAEGGPVYQLPAYAAPRPNRAIRSTRPGKALPAGHYHCKQPIMPELGRRAGRAVDIDLPWRDHTGGGSIPSISEVMALSVGLTEDGQAPAS